MGMWQGILEGMNQVEAKKTREQELQDARDERAKEFQQQLALKEADYKRSRADTLADYQMRREDEAKDATTAKTTKLSEALVPLVVKRIQEEKAAKVITGPAQALYDMFDDPKDPKLQILKENPTVAAEIYNQIQEIKKTAAEKGLPDLPLEGKALRDSIFVSRTGEVGYVPLDYASILETPVESLDKFAEVSAALTTPLPSATYVLDPKLHYIPDTKNMTVAGDAFDIKVIEAASAAQSNYGESATEWTQLQELIQNYEKDPNARVKLRSNYGQQAFEGLLASGNPISKTIIDAPEMSTFAEVYKAKGTLREIIASTTDADMKARAQAKLAELEGRS